MKIRDIIIYESHQDTLIVNIQDVIMMFKSNDIKITTLANIKLELDKRDFIVTLDDISGIVSDMGYSVENGNITISDSDSDESESDIVHAEDVVEIEGSEYSPAADKAKSAIRKRMK